MTKLEQIREIIIKNDSSILDLKFGCAIEIAGNTKFIIDTHTAVDGMDWNYIVRDEINQHMFREVRMEEMEKYLIIGRTITLSDVLGAVNDRYSFDGGGWVLYKQEGKSWLGKDKKIFWNLKDNNLNNQSKETISFIHKILGSLNSGGGGL